MINEIFFEQSDQEKIDYFLQKPLPYALKDPTVEKLLEVWERFVDTLEADYAGSIFEYVYWLEMRSLLAEIVEQLSSEGQANLVTYLTPLDKRYIEATTAITYPIRGNYVKDFWWWYRIPRKFLESQDLQLFPKLSFDQSDEEKIKQLLTGVSKVAPLEQRLDALISRWIRFVVQVKHGYRLDAYTYTLRLHGREILENICITLSEGGQRELLRVLRPADDLFEAHTVPASSHSPSFLGEFTATLLWLNRLPIQMSERLKKQFAELGVFPKNEDKIS